MLPFCHAPTYTGTLTFMASFIDRLFGHKSGVPFIGTITEQTREGINKSYIPKFLYKPPYGYPRFADVTYIRFLAQTPYVEMCIKTIIAEICGIDWDILPVKGLEDQANDNEIEHIRSFFRNPNTNNESFEDVFIKMPVRDLLETNTACLNKVFNLKEEMVEIVARDAATFTKNPDIHGMFTNRDDILLPKEILEVNTIMQSRDIFNPLIQITDGAARERAAYFQYGWLAGPAPIPFGKREIVWLQDMVRTDDHYGTSPVQILAKNLQMLLYQIDSELDYFNNNNVPKGVIGLDKADADELNAFKEQWYDQTRTKDELGNFRKLMHKVPITNRMPEFARIEFSSAELQIIEKQQWYTKMVWASFGITPTELGYTFDASGVSNQIVQSKVFRKKAIYPLLRILENRYNEDIISEFGYTTTMGKNIVVNKYCFKFKTFDIDEEKNKYELYDLQIKSGMKTVNEVREIEGLDEVPWGDKPPREWQAPTSSFNFGGGSDKQDSEEQGLSSAASRLKRQAMEADKEMFDQGAEEAKAAAAQEDNPLVITHPETIRDPERLTKAIDYVLTQAKETLLTHLDKEGQNILKQVKSEGKSLDQLIPFLKNLFNVGALKALVGVIIKNNFLAGHESTEKDLNRNFMPDRNAIDYLSDMTFSNIKDMTTQSADKLRGILQRGIVHGEGIATMKAKIADAFDMSMNRAATIARTETARASVTGRLLAYKASGIRGTKRWLATIDEKTCDICARLNGQEVGIDDNFVDPDGEFEGKSAPVHPNCRCDFEVVPDSFKDAFQEKAARLKKNKIANEELDLKLKQKEIELLEVKNNLIKRLNSQIDEQEKDA